jgi:hypothetical protein
MKTAFKTLLVAGAIALASQASAVVIFSDNFNGENGGNGVLNYAGFANWTISDGTVDLIGLGFIDLIPGNGLYVDLDGSTGNAGVMTSIGIAVTPGDYVLTFLLAGSQRGDTNQVGVNIPGFTSDAYTLASNAPFALRTLPFTVGSATTINLVFANSGGDNLGALLDNVQLERRDVAGVPDGGLTAILLGMGMIALGWGRRMIK